jgi:hypothetical protein
MEFIRKLFGGGGSRGGSVGDRAGLYFYVKPNGCSEIVRVRINSNNDLSLADDNKTYFVRKMVRGTSYKCNREAELEVSFDANRRLTEQKVTGGALVTQQEFEAWLASQETSQNAS